MTPTDDVRAWRDAMPRRAIAQLHDTQAVVALITKAISEQGWTVAQLVAECSRDLNVVNPGAVITHRLRRCAEIKPVPEPFAPRPFCSPECCENAGWRLDSVTGLPAERCECRQGDAT